MERCASLAVGDVYVGTVFEQTCDAIRKPTVSEIMERRPQPETVRCRRASKSNHGALICSLKFASPESRDAACPA